MKEISVDEINNIKGKTIEGWNYIPPDEEFGERNKGYLTIIFSDYTYLRINSDDADNYRSWLEISYNEIH